MGPARGSGPDEDAGSSPGRSALWLLAGKGLAFAQSVALPLVLVRALSLHEYGLYKQVFLVVGTAVALLPLGFATTAYYFLPRSPERGAAVALNILAVHLAVGGLAGGALILLPELLGRIFRDGALVPYAPLTGGVVFLWVVGSALEPIVVGAQETRLAAFLIAGRQLVKTLLSLLAVLWLPGLPALLAAGLLYGVADVALLVGYLARRFGKFWRCFEGALLRSQLAYALPHGFAVLLWFVQAELHQYVVASRFDAAVFAVYAIGCFQLPLVAILSESVSSVLIPRVSRLQLEDRRREMLVLTLRMVTRLGAVLLPLYLFVLVAGRELIAALFTTRYDASWPIFAVNATLVPLSLLATACDPVIRGFAEQRYFLIRLRLALAGILAVVLWGFVEGPQGPLVAVSSVIVVQAAERVLVGLRVARLLRAGRSDLPLLGGLARIGVAALTAGAGALVVRQLTSGPPLIVLGWCAAAFGAFYAVSLALLGMGKGRLGFWNEAPAALSSS